ncbi:protein tramtrack, alpha isoform-like isoform X2 [Periplaneta americana]|uniref:protein tramtrack, alpha isoform-like isoform X2 n=1 Tax=Periplaneta americana TaxID=6978 RepID=UPI0037E783EA
MAADQFCLRWNNFQLNIASALDSLKTDEDLVDVTLSCEGQNVKAHKVVLSACSPYFRGVFKENPCQHPIVILKDVSFEDVTALLSFMYQGEVYITQDRLASFLHTAELLQVRGLTGATNPFKDAPKQCKMKKPVPTSAGQLRHDTPPLASPPSMSIPLPPSSKTHPLSKSPVMGKEPLSLSLIQQTALNSSTTLHHQHTVPYQQTLSILPGETSHHVSDSDPPNHQTPSPQPPSAKRRKAFPRRVSVGGHEVAESPERTKSSEEQIGCEVVSMGVAPVKQEPEDESVLEVDATIEEESNPLTFTNTEEDVVHMESPNSDVTRRLDYYGNVETVVSEDPDIVKEEGVSSLAPHSMLLRSLSGVKQPDASPSRIGDGTAPPRTSDEGDDVGRASPRRHRGLWRCMQPRICPVCFKTFSTSFNLKQHIQNVHLPSQGIQCPLCRKCFKNKRYLRKHLVTFHGAPLKRVRTQDGHIVHVPENRF